MKPRHFLLTLPSPRSSSPCFIRLALGGALLASSIASAATQYWDPGLTPTANGGKGSGGNGTWTTAGANWSDGAADAALTITNIAGFGGSTITPGGTVALTTAVSAGGLQFDTNNYVIGNGTNTGQISINSQASTNGISVAGGVTGTSINVGSIKLGSVGSGTAIQLTNTDLVNFNNTTIYLSGARNTRISNSSTSSTTTLKNFALSDKPTGGTWPTTSTSLEVGNLTITNLAAAANANGTLATFTSATAVNATFNGSGSGAFTINGNNTLFNNVGAGGSLSLTFSMANGTLALGHDNALGARNASNALTTTSLIMTSGTVAASGGTRNIENKLTIGGNIGIGGSNNLTFSNDVTNSAGNRTVTVGNSALTTLAGSVYLSNDETARILTIAGTGNTTVTGVIANNNAGNTVASSLTKSGSGTLTASNAASTYTGVTTVSDGVLSVAALANGGSNSPIGASANTATNLVIGSTGTLQYTGSTVTTDRGFDTTAGTGKIEVTNAGTTLTFSGSADSVTKTGAGTLVLSGSNSYSGLTVSGGTLRIANPTFQSISGTLTANAGGTLQLGGSNNDQLHDNSSIAIASGGFLDMAGLSEKVKDISGSGTVINSGGSQSILTVSGFSGNTVFDGAITGNVALTHTDPNCSTTLNGLNTYSGNTNINNSTATFSVGSTGGMTFYIGANGVNNWINGAAGATVNLDGVFTFDLTNAALASGNLWNIVENGDLVETFGTNFAVAGFSQVNDIWTRVDGDNTWIFSEASGALTLGVAAVPEPGSLALGAIGMLALIRRKNR